MLPTQITQSIATFSYHEFFTHIELFTMDRKTSLGVFTGEIKQGLDGIRFSITLLSSEVIDLSRKSTPGKLSDGEYIMEATAVGRATPVIANIHIQNSKTGSSSGGIIIEAFTYQLQTQEILQDEFSSINTASALLYPVENFFTTEPSEYTTKQAGNTVTSYQTDKLSLDINQMKLNFTLDKSASCLKLTISKVKDADATIDENTLAKAISSVRFMLGKDVTSLISEVTKDGIITQKIMTTSKGVGQSINPPILDIENNFQCKDLYIKHCEYLLGSDNNLNLIERSVIGSAGASLEAQCLTIGVASESIVSEILDKQIKVQEGYFSKDKIKSFEEYAFKWFPEVEDDDNEETKAAKQRIAGLVGQLYQVQVKQKLNAISSNINNSDELLKSWDKLRNKAAHGRLFIKNDDTQTYFDHYSNTLSLFYQLVFLTIGYNGIYTEYSQDGYPSMRFKGSMKTDKERE